MARPMSFLFRAEGTGKRRAIMLMKDLCKKTTIINWYKSDTATVSYTHLTLPTSDLV